VSRCPSNPSFQVVPRATCRFRLTLSAWTLSALTALASSTACNRRTASEQASSTSGASSGQPASAQAQKAPPASTPNAAPLGTTTPYLPVGTEGEEASDQHLPMDLPQPLAEPTPEQDPSQYVPADPPWPDSLTEVYGSELVEKVKEAARTRGVKGVLINAWASWCGPCKTEMPLLLDVRKRYAERGIDVWFVSVDKSADAEQVNAVLKERSIPEPHYVVKGRLGYFKEALSPIWKGSLPSTFLFDANGRVRYYWGAHVFEHELLPLLDDFLAGKHIDGMANYKVRRGAPNP
jgi:thiol-disulfide isomerase/thioredoxin